MGSINRNIFFAFLVDRSSFGVKAAFRGLTFRIQGHVLAGSDVASLLFGAPARKLTPDASNLPPSNVHVIALQHGPHFQLGRGGQGMISHERSVISVVDPV